MRDLFAVANLLVLSIFNIINRPASSVRYDKHMSIYRLHVTKIVTRRQTTV